MSNFVYRGTSTYQQGENSLNSIGSFAEKIGKKAFIISGSTAWEVAGERISDSLKKAGLAFEVVFFKGFCTLSHIVSLFERFQQSDADFLIGVGGGRVIDVTKGVALKSGASFVLAPTSVSQCACCANVIVMYEDNGDPSPSALHLDHSASAVIVDTDILTRHCPARMFATGIADAMAKLPEIEFLRAVTTDWKKVFLSNQSFQMAVDSYQLYLQTAEKAYHDVQRGILSEEVDQLITANLLLTGFASALASGTRQIAFAHNFYYAFCLFFKEYELKYMHGEVVSAALLWQLSINGADSVKLEECRKLLRSIDMPCCADDLNIVISEEIQTAIIEYCKNNMPYLTPELLSTARNKFPALQSNV